jgi:predicted hotdog family 3-hydroxylacyl-ACP dehydratase
MIKGEELYELLPQSHPMVMIDQFVSSNEKTTVTSFHIKPDNILLLDGKLSEAGIIENIAQTAAARSGYEAKKKQSSCSNRIYRLNKKLENPFSS